MLNRVVVCLFIFIGRRSGGAGVSVSMATEKLFRIIFYLKTTRGFFCSSFPQTLELEVQSRAFCISSIQLKKKKRKSKVLDVCQMYSHCSGPREKFPPLPCHADPRASSRQMRACSNFSRVDVLLIQPLFIPPGIDVPLQSPRQRRSYKNTFVTHSN